LFQLWRGGTIEVVRLPRIWRDPPLDQEQVNLILWALADIRDDTQQIRRLLENDEEEEEA
jgi:hypothetical protein